MDPFLKWGVAIGEKWERVAREAERTGANRVGRRVVTARICLAPGPRLLPATTCSHPW